MDIFSKEMLAAMSQPDITMLYAVRLDLPSGMARYHTDIGTFNHFPFDMDESFHGVGNLGSISDTQYGSGDDTTPAVTLELSTRDEGVRRQILAGGYQGRKGELYLVVMDKHGEVLAWSMHFDGVMDSGKMKQGDNNVIQLPLTAPDDGMEHGLNWRCTDGSHQAQHSGDTFYKYAVRMEDFKTYWGFEKDGIPLRNL
ncbi:hypothetical protein ACWX0P_27405 [Vibrio mediterranei]